MNDEFSEPTDREGWLDRLVDSGLAESLGGDAPPDLQERILAAARAEGVPCSPVTKESTMATVAGPRWWTRRSTLLALCGGTLAAGLLLALVLPATQSAREAAQRIDAAQAVDQQAARRLALDASTRSHNDERTSPDFTVDLDVPFRQGSYPSQVAAEPAVPGQDQVTMMATPRIIIESEAEDRLGVTEEKRGAERESLLKLAASTPTPAEASGPGDFGYAAPQGAASGGMGGGMGGFGGGMGGGFGGAAAAPMSAPSRQHRDTPVRVWHSTRSYAHEAESLADSPLLSDTAPHDRVDGLGPGQGGDKYARVEDNPFKAISTANTDNRLSTFSIDVDTAAYANVRQFLMESRQLPPADAVRIEELVNYFPYDYAPPAANDEAPFAAHVEAAACPWNDAHRLVRIGVKGRELDRRARPQSNLVFLVDVSGSMNEPNKLPLVVEGLRMLAGELGENDRVAIVVYASSEGLALPSTPGTQKEKILAVLDALQAGGSTAGGAGIQLAYQTAQDNFVKGGVNRVILCTDGDFNVGVTSPAELERLAETKAKETGVFLTVLGFGRGNLNDAMMEQISNKGNGNYHYVDNQREARKVLVEEMTGTLVTIAKDVKLQVEFNPAQVAGYRLIGYENRVLAAEDFNDDKKDAGEIGAGHAVTALYEVIPAGQQVEAPGVDELKYSPPASEGSARGEERPAAEKAQGGELCTLKIRYKQPDGDVSTKLEFPIVDQGEGFAAASDDFQFAAAVASFGMLLRESPYKGQSSFGAVAEIAESASRDRDPHGYRREFIEMVRRAGELTISN